MRTRSDVAVWIAFTLLPWLVAAQSTQDAGIFRWDGQRWVQHEGSGTRISVGPDGSPWVVNARNEIYRSENGAFRRLPGAAKDIGVGADGRAWIIGTDDRVYQSNGSRWIAVPGSGARISAGAPGTAWVVNQAGEIYRWQSGTFERLPGSAIDVGVNARGDAWVIGTPAPVQSGNQLLLFRERDFRGRPFAIDGPRRSLPGLFSQARSLRVRGGVWEVCESPGFEGRCLTVSSDVADLASIGLPNFVGSVRPRAGPTPR